MIATVTATHPKRRCPEPIAHPYLQRYDQSVPLPERVRRVTSDIPSVQRPVSCCLGIQLSVSNECNIPHMRRTSLASFTSMMAHYGYNKQTWLAKAGQRPSSHAPHDHSTVLGYARKVIVFVNFCHVLRRRVQRLVGPNFEARFLKLFHRAVSQAM